MLVTFQEGAKAGVTRLLAAFFFRQYGQRPSGDPTFIFTHKSFGEYLTARRVVRAIGRVIRELERCAGNLDEGWDERDALKHWAQIFGPSAITPYLHNFLLNEMKLHSIEELAQWQNRLASLFSYMLRNGMPMEQLGIVPFKKAMFQSRNSEEALLVALNACARITMQVISIEQPNQTAFGAWFRLIQGQRSGPKSVLAARCLSFLHLSGIHLDISDFYKADLRYANLQSVRANLACFGDANLENADLRNAIFADAMIRGGIFNGANLEGAYLERTNLKGANLEGAYLERANLKGADLTGANLEGARLPAGFQFLHETAKEKKDHTAWA